MSLMFYLGVRISDVQKLGSRNEVNDRMVFTTQKRVSKQRQGVDINLPSPRRSEPQSKQLERRTSSASITMC
tara:strand:- start:212 stop:427 length:216 start_codon:yes stop_codon:yes gene_type:complete